MTISLASVKVQESMNNITSLQSRNKLMINILWKYRYFIWRNGWYELCYRYAGSSLGFFWHVLNPLFQIMIYTFIFSNLMKVRVPNLSNASGFAIYLCSGLLPWLGFSETLQKCSQTLVDNANYLKKIAIPEAVFLARDAVSGLLGSLLSLLVLVIITPLLGHQPALSWLCLPLLMTLFILLAYGLGMIIAALNVFFRDTSQALTIAIQLWFWATPIVYLANILPPNMSFIFKLNPAYYYIDTFHLIIVNRQFPAVIVIVCLTTLSLIAVLLGNTVLRSLRSQIKDCL